MKKLNKKPLIALVLVALLGVVGVTIAYFTSEDTFGNVFKTKPYKMVVLETFESPANWTPGTTTDKTVVATNKGDVEAAVRVSYTEEWKDSANQVLALKDADNRPAAIINFADDLATKWTESTENGTKYYYYKTKLGKDQSSTSFIKSVTFNPAVTIASTDNCEVDETHHTKTCTTTASGYSGGTYTLNVKVETVQFDQYKTAWGTTVEIN